MTTREQALHRAVVRALMQIDRIAADQRRKFESDLLAHDVDVDAIDATLEWSEEEMREARPQLIQQITAILARLA